MFKELKPRLIILGIFLISIVSSQTIYSGETVYFDLQDQIQNLQTVHCEIINNNSNLEGLNLTFNNTGYTISTVINFQPNNFTVQCILNGYKIVTQNSGGSSSSGGSTSCYVNWTCSEWSNCLNELSTRTCERIPLRCFGKPTEKPIESKSCNTIILNNETPTIATDIEEPIKEKDLFLTLFICVSCALILTIGGVAWYLKFKNQRYKRVKSL